MQPHHPISAVLCGAGNRGLEGYGGFALQYPHQLIIRAVCDPLAERRTLAKNRHDIPEELLFDDWSALLKVEKLADVAIVATPDNDHVEPTLALMKHGYDVLLEKPMALTEGDCWRLVHQSEESDRILTVCHVLRYAPYFREMKRFLDSGRLGELMTVRHFEPVNHWRFAHSFVRGNWSRTSDSSPFILSKSCHDFDLLTYLIDQPCRKVSSFGNLSHFKPSRKPESAAHRCLDCPLAEKDCIFSATRYYGALLESGHRGWPLNVLLTDFEKDELEKALRKGPYGRCVYDGQNDVVDHQVVALEFEGGLTATFTATAFSDHRTRETELMGTKGSLRGDGTNLEFFDFNSRQVSNWKVEASGLHLGGDDAMMESFLRAVRSRDRTLLDTGPRESVASHIMAFAAERSRLSGQTEEIRLP